MPPNGRGTWKVRPMPSLHRAAASSRVTRAPSKRISPDPGSRSPAIRPNRLVLPAPFGPTIPTMSPGAMLSESPSATTTFPNLFVTRSSSSRADAAASGIRGLELGRDRHVGVQRVVDNLHDPRVLTRAWLPLNADRPDDPYPGYRAGREVQRAAHSGVVHLVQFRGDRARVVRVVDRGERLLGHLEQAVAGADRLGPLVARGRLVGVGQGPGRLAVERGLVGHV